MKLLERVGFTQDSGVVADGDKWVLKNVVLLGQHSRNKSQSGKPRRYTFEALEAALPKFHQLQVNVNHPPRNAQGEIKAAERSVTEVIGQSINPRLVQEASDGKSFWKVVGDIEIVKGPIGDHIVKLAKLNPRLIGMSITGDGTLKESDEFCDVTGLIPETVDVVHRPATTKGLFEGADATKDTIDKVIAEIESEAPVAGSTTPETSQPGEQVPSQSLVELQKKADKACEDAREATKAAMTKKTVELHLTAELKHKYAIDCIKDALKKALVDSNMDAFVRLNTVIREHRRFGTGHQLAARLIINPKDENVWIPEGESVEVKSPLIEAWGNFKKPKRGLEDKDEEDEEDERDEEDEEDERDVEGKEVENDKEGGRERALGPGMGGDETGEGGSVFDSPEEEAGSDEREEQAGADAFGASNDGSVNPEEITDFANSITQKANMEDSSDAHLQAAWAHGTAAFMLSKLGAGNKCLEHWSTALAHNARSEKLRAEEGPLHRQPGPNVMNPSVGQGVQQAAPTAFGSASGVVGG
jgi:hypothetical protein